MPQKEMLASRVDPRRRRRRDPPTGATAPSGGYQIIEAVTGGYSLTPASQTSQKITLALGTKLEGCPPPLLKNE